MGRNRRANHTGQPGRSPLPSHDADAVLDLNGALVLLKQRTVLGARRLWQAQMERKKAATPRANIKRSTHKAMVLRDDQLSVMSFQSRIFG